MTDEEIRQLISRYLDDQLDDEERREVERLITESDEYEKYYRQLKTLAEQVDEFDVDGSDEYWTAQKDAVMDRLEQLEEKQITRISSEPMPVLYKWLAVAASIALVALISVNESQNIPWIKGMFAPKEEIPSASYIVPSEKSYSAISPVIDSVGQVAADRETDAVKEEMAGKVSVDSDLRESLSDEMQIPLEQQKADTPSTAETYVKKPTAESIGHIVNPKAQIPNESLATRPDAEPESEMKTKVSRPAPEPAEQPSPERRAEVVRQKSTSLVQSDIAKSIAVEGIRGDVDTISARARHDDFATPSPEIVDESFQPDVAKFQVTSNSLSATSEVPLDSAVAGREYWQNRLDSLIKIHGDIESINGRTRAATGRRTDKPDSSSAVILSYAEAYYHLGLLSTDKSERQSYLLKLQALQNRADSAKSEIIATFIDRIRSLK